MDSSARGKGLDKPTPAGAMVWQCKVLEEALGVRKRATLCVDLQKLLRFAPWRRRVEYVVVPPGAARRGAGAERALGVGS